MKLYSEHPTANTAMGHDPALRLLLRQIIADERIQAVVETGTFLGLGSTTLVAEAFPAASPPLRFVTIEANRASWEEAQRNLQRFAFVTTLWGLSVPLREARQFLATDECLRDHTLWPEIWIDDVTDPLGFYTREVLGQLGGASNHGGDAQFAGEDLLRRELDAARDLSLLVTLDSAGGIGLLEFTIARERLRERPYLLLLDDVHHLKHFRSLDAIKADERFSILGSNSEDGWVLARHVP